jgi:hypothetical protein
MLGRMTALDVISQHFGFFADKFKHLHLTSPLAVISSVTSACLCLQVSEVNQRPLSKSSKFSALYLAGFPAVLL